MEAIRYHRAKQLLALKFDMPIPLRKEGDRNWWKLRVSIDGDIVFIQNNIDHVVYYTHPTFPKKLQEITVRRRESNFALDLNVWGRFIIRARIYLNNGELVELSELLPALRS